MVSGSERGLTLIELLVVLALVALLLRLGSQGWQRSMTLVRQIEAGVALAHNARHLERWHANHQNLHRKDAKRRWVALPMVSTGYYRIEFGAVSEAAPGRYRLLARPEFTWLGREILRLDQDGMLVRCVSFEQPDICVPL